MNTKSPKKKLSTQNIPFNEIEFQINWENMCEEGNWKV